MAKIYPRAPACSSYMTSRRETFTLWMKSLLFHGNGCTVFDSKGEIVYRIDNYDKKSSDEVYLMDRQGKVLFSIRPKKLAIFRQWDIYKWSGSKTNRERCPCPWFRARKCCNFLGRDMACHVSLGCDKSKESSYRILGLAAKLAYRITDSHGRIVAEVRQKQLSSGVFLGDDVLSLVVEPQTDHSIVMALVTVFGLMTAKI